MRSPYRPLYAAIAPIWRGAQAAARRASAPPSTSRPSGRGFAAVIARLASEQGFAVPTVMLMTVAALAMAGVAVTTTVGGQGGVVRDQGTKSALAVAESGADQALLHFNRYGLVPGTTPCAPVGTTPDAEGWCGEVTGTTVNGGTVSYRVKPTSSKLPNGETAFTELEVVALGTFAGVTRRVDVSASSSSGLDVFLDAAVQSKDGIALNSNAEIHAGTATNGDITLAINAKQCGTTTVGIGKEMVGEGGYYSDLGCTTSGGTALEDEISLPPVNQGDAPTNNDNDRLFKLDRISGNKNTVCFNGFDGNNKASASCGARELTIGSNSSVTLGGSVYSFCKLTLNSNSSLYIEPAKAGGSVTIYFDSPEACGYKAGTAQLELLSNSRITSEDGEATDLALLFVGSPNTSTKILLNSETAVDGPCEQNFVIYAPYTDIELDSNTRFCGALAGKTVTLSSFAQVWTSSGLGSFVLPNTAPHYVVDRFVDCSTSPTTPPDKGC